jgi:hypothetical protein
VEFKKGYHFSGQLATQQKDREALIGPNAGTSATATRPERRGVSRQRQIKAAKEAVSTLELAKRLCGASGRLEGARWRARCPLPGHEDHSPSFTVYLATNSWYCFGACQRGGDVLDLAAAAWGYERHEVAMAAADLLYEFGHRIPEQPPSWYAKQKRQKPARDADEEAKIRHLQRRVFRRFEPLLESIEDDQERNEEANLLWEASREISVLVWAGRRSA